MRLHGQPVRSVVLHVRPNGFRRARYCGFLSAHEKKKRVTHCRRLLSRQRGIFSLPYAFWLLNIVRSGPRAR